ncbi:MarR family winged helix-turn-helix transcriptional regulator [Kutzneria sp. CA-103260]|uniref:MarR family winged helix-turn-helix transcriptional regulator n=1 Tax=Kutzneria sp. CA-103260 TaxID=2802641 RepID=UPI001BA74CCE|nr:MarR family transcriptional regulator [Kutzneria sp. CA-103260]
MTATPTDDTPTGPALTALLRGRLREVSVLIEQHGEAALAGTSLSLPLNHLLDTVVAEPGVTVTEIANRLGKSQQAISQAANRLEKLGYIERRVGTGRAVALHATSTGRNASAEAVARELAAEDRVRELLGPERFDTLMALLAATRDTLRDEA